MSSRRAGITALAVVAVAGGGVAAGVFLARGDSGAGDAAAPTSSAPTASAEPTDGALDPLPTRAPAVSADPTSGQTIATDEPVVATGEQVPVVITYHGYDPAADVVMVGGYVAGVVESEGVCTLTLTRAGRTVTGESQAVPDASTTACGEVAVPGADLADGTWQAELSYASGAHSGTSDAWDVEVAR
jgi:hypothetical protein